MNNNTHSPDLPYSEEDAYRRHKVAVLGGTFDPIHKGHIALAQTVLDKGMAEEVVFVPAARPPHKLDKPITPAKQRLALLKAALADKPGMSISDVEIISGRKTSYTYNTLETLSLVYPGKELCLIIGMDNFKQLNTWHRYRDLIRDYNFITFERPGTPRISFAETADKFGAHNAKKLLESIISDVQVDISSTEIRQAIQDGTDISDKLTEPTINFINEHNIYA